MVASITGEVMTMAAAASFGVSREARIACVLREERRGAFRTRHTLGEPDDPPGQRARVVIGGVWRLPHGASPFDVYLLHIASGVIDAGRPCLGAPARPRAPIEASCIPALSASTVSPLQDSAVSTRTPPATGVNVQARMPTMPKPPPPRACAARVRRDGRLPLADVPALPSSRQSGLALPGTAFIGVLLLACRS